jgi:RND family efflux transporter MFP subunit
VLPARVKAREEVTIEATLAARLTSLPFAEGRTFSRGDALARFEAPETRRALEAARAALESARVRREQAVLQEARMESLFVERVASQREREIAESDRRAAESDEAAARAAEARWSAGTAIAAPFAGVVIHHRVDPGQSVNPGQPLLDVRSTEAGEIETPIPESEIERVRAARVRVQVGDGEWRPARVARLDGMTDFNTRTRVATLAVTGGAKLEPGAFARARFEAPTAPGNATAPASASASRGPSAAIMTSRAVAIPVSAVVHRGSLAGVYVVRGDRAELRWLRLGRASGGTVEVLAGLAAGEDIAADPVGLADGRAVRVAR